jgi:mono/diheme cytochrome c family protein
MTIQKRFLSAMVTIAACSLIIHWRLPAVAWSAIQQNTVQASPKADRDDAKAASAFASIIPVLRHPRCMNCHSSGDFPRQGDDLHPHTMNVRRGLNGQGIAGLRCSTCHQNHNLAGEHMPPGAPDWHLPPPREPMIWEGLSDRQLCELFKDPARNGHRTVDGIVQHMNTPLVLWGWHPGEGRTPIPMPESEFLGKVKEWASNGTACPSESSTPQPTSGAQ